MSKVEKVEDFADAIAKATEHDAVVMAEKWITGREFTIVILNGQATCHSSATARRCGFL